MVAIRLDQKTTDTATSRYPSLDTELVVLFEIGKEVGVPAILPEPLVVQPDGVTSLRFLAGLVRDR